MQNFAWNISFSYNNLSFVPANYFTNTTYGPHDIIYSFTITSPAASFANLTVRSTTPNCPVSASLVFTAVNQTKTFYYSCNTILAVGNIQPTISITTSSTGYVLNSMYWSVIPSIPWLTGSTGAIGPIGATGSIWLQGIKGNTGSIGPIGLIWSTGSIGATGSVDIQWSVNNLILSISGGLSSPAPSVSYSGITIQGFFDILQSNYDLPSYRLVLHLNAFWSLDGAFPDIVLTGTGLFINSAVSIFDPSDPRIVLTLIRQNSGDILSCGWYGVNIIPSLIQWLSGGAYPNSVDIGTAFELTGCPGYKPTTPLTISGSLGNTGTSFVPPSASGMYIGLTYTDSTGATYFDMNALFLIAIYLSWILAIFYSFFLLYKRTILWKKSR